MFDILAERIHQRYRTLSYPDEQPQLSPAYCGLPAITCTDDDCTRCTDVCPTHAMTIRDRTVLDLGRCTFCGACRDVCPENAIRFTKEFRLAVRRRDSLCVMGPEHARSGDGTASQRTAPQTSRTMSENTSETVPQNAPETLPDRRAGQDGTDRRERNTAEPQTASDSTAGNRSGKSAGEAAQTGQTGSIRQGRETDGTDPGAPLTCETGQKSLCRDAGDHVEQMRNAGTPGLSRPFFRRSFKIRQVSCGGCAACEADCNVLGTLVYDMGRYGIDFVASPRHADALLVTGPVTENMRRALIDTYRAVPEPRSVIACGTCAVSGGLFAESSDCHRGVQDILPVDLYIPGCPPNPWTILDALIAFKEGRETAMEETSGKEKTGKEKAGEDRG